MPANNFDENRTRDRSRWRKGRAVREGRSALFVLNRRVSKKSNEREMATDAKKAVPEHRQIRYNSDIDIEADGTIGEAGG